MRIAFKDCLQSKHFLVCVEAVKRKILEFCYATEYLSPTVRAGRLQKGDAHIIVMKSAQHLY